MTTRNFHKWETEEILQWLWDYETVPSLQTICNYYTYISAIEEMRSRKLTENEVREMIKSMGESDDI